VEPTETTEEVSKPVPVTVSRKEALPAYTLAGFVPAICGVEVPGRLGVEGPEEPHP
jgi:hypothetical protein